MCGMLELVNPVEKTGTVAPPGTGGIPSAWQKVNKGHLSRSDKDMCVGPVHIFQRKSATIHARLNKTRPFL